MAQHAGELLEILDVAANMLTLPPDEIQTVTVVGLLPPGMR